MFNKELYKRLNANEIDTLYAFNLLNDKEKEIILKNFDINNTKIKKCNTIIDKMKSYINKLYKINLYDYFDTYDITSINNSFNKLKKEQQELILKRYTLGNTKERKENITDKEYSKIRYYLKVIFNDINNLKKEVTIKYKSLEDTLNTTRTTILELILLLDNKELELLYKKYGDNLLDLDKKDNLTLEEKIYIGTTLIKKLKRYLDKLNNGYRIYSIFDILSIDSNLFYERINILSDKEINKLKSIFNIKFDKRIILNDIEYKNICDNLNNIRIKLLSDRKRLNNEIISFYDLFINYKKEDETINEYENRLLSIFNSLSEEDKNITYKKYGKKLNIIDGNNSTSENSKLFFRIVYPKIKYKLEFISKRNNMTLFERLNKYGTNKDILIALCNLSYEEIDLLRKYYGFTLTDRPKLIKEEDKELIKNIISKLVRIIYKNKKIDTGIDICVLKSIRKLLNANEFKELCKYYDKSVVYAYLIKKYYVNISDENISNITGVKISDDIILKRSK